MHCFLCGARLRLNTVSLNDGHEWNCYTCDSCPVHFTTSDALHHTGQAVLLPMGGLECPGCGTFLPYDAETFTQLFGPEGCGT